jgi:hypothetical protein
MGAAALAVAAMLPAAATFARPAFYTESFESGLGIWGPSGFSARPIQVTQSNTVASDGVFSMKVTQDGDGFSWNTKAEGNSSNLNSLYQGFNAVSNLPENQVFIEFDVLYHHAEIPDNATFMNMSVYINNDNGFRQVDQLALDDGNHIANNIDQTIHVQIPISSFSGFGDKIPSNANFYQLGWSMNGNWGAGNGTAGDGIGDASVYYDNVQITAVPEPGTIGLAAIGLSGLALRRRRA